jgi:hypothetical protein
MAKKKYDAKGNWIGYEPETAPAKTAVVEGDTVYGANSKVVQAGADTPDKISAAKSYLDQLNRDKAKPAGAPMSPEFDAATQNAVKLGVASPEVLGNVAGVGTQSILNTQRVAAAPSAFTPSSPAALPPGIAPATQESMAQKGQQLASDYLAKRSVLEKASADRAVAFRDGLAMDKEQEAQTKTDLSNQRDTLAMARANWRNIRKGLARGKVYGAGEVTAAKDSVRDAFSGIGSTSNVDERANFFGRPNPFSRARNR